MPDRAGFDRLGPDRLDLIRHAIERGDFAHARTLWEEHARNVTVSDWPRTTDLYEWSRTTLLCARAHLLDRLNALKAAEKYLSGS